MRTCVLILLAAASAAAFTPAPPVSRWSEYSPASTAAAPLLRTDETDEFDRVRVDTMISAIRYLFMPKQAVLVSADYVHGDPTFFFGYQGMEGNVRTAIFPESQFADPSLWVKEDIYSAGGAGTLRYVCPSAFWSDSSSAWYPQVAFEASTPPTSGFMYDPGGMGAGMWTDPLPIGGEDGLYLPMIETGPENTVYMIGERRDISGSDLVFRSFDGWTGELIDPPGEVTLFPGDPIFLLGYENYELLYRQGRIVAAMGGYRTGDFYDPNNPLLIVFTESSDGGLTWSEPVWLDKATVPDLPGSIPGIQGHYSNSFFDGLIDDWGRLHFLAVIADSGWFGNETSPIWGLYDIRETETEWGWTAAMVTDGVYPDFNPRELLGGDTWIHSPSLAAIGDFREIVAIWNDISGIDPDGSARIGIRLAQSMDLGCTWSLPLDVSTGQVGDEYFSRLVPLGSVDEDGNWRRAYVLTMPTGGQDGPFDLIECSWFWDGSGTAPVVPGFVRLVGPMPVSERASFDLTLTAVCAPRISVFGLDGRLITSLHRGTLPPGIHRLHWDCSGTSSGVYICQVNVGDEATAAGVIVVH